MLAWSAAAARSCCLLVPPPSSPAPPAPNYSPLATLEHSSLPLLRARPRFPPASIPILSCPLCHRLLTFRFSPAGAWSAGLVCCRHTNSWPLGDSPLKPRSRRPQLLAPRNAATLLLSICVPAPASLPHPHPFLPAFAPPSITLVRIFRASLSFCFSLLCKTNRSLVRRLSPPFHFIAFVSLFLATFVFIFSAAVAFVVAAAFSRSGIDVLLSLAACSAISVAFLFLSSRLGFVALPLLCTHMLLQSFGASIEVRCGHIWSHVMFVLRGGRK